MLLLRNNISNNILRGAGWVVGWVYIVLWLCVSCLVQAGLFAGMQV